MHAIPCPQGRLQAACLAALNLRAVVEPATLTYVSVAPSKLAPVMTSVPAKYRPREASGQFARYADLMEAINVDWAFTNFEFDQRDRFGEINAWDDLDGPLDSFFIL